MKRRLRCVSIYVHIHKYICICKYIVCLVRYTLADTIHCIVQLLTSQINKGILWSGETINCTDWSAYNGLHYLTALTCWKRGQSRVEMGRQGPWPLRGRCNHWSSCYRRHTSDCFKSLPKGHMHSVGQTATACCNTSAWLEPRAMPSLWRSSEIGIHVVCFKYHLMYTM